VGSVLCIRDSTSPVGVLVGLLAGITAACYVAFVQFSRYL
jgi:hypothetical protein